MKRSRVHLKDDPREIPLYTISDVARFLRIGATSLANWTRPHHRHRQGKITETFAPLITVCRTSNPDELLSFYNAIEAHVLLAARRYHGVSMLGVNRAVAWVREKLPSPHTLADYQFSVKGKHLFLEKLDDAEAEESKTGIVDASQHGQTVISSFLNLYLDRIERDSAGNGFRFFPVVPGSNGETQPVMMDIHLASGNLVIAHTGVSASVVYGRYKAGHSIQKLSSDYRLSPDKIEGAIKYFQAAA